MPTVYTMDIEKGIAFRQYALSCADIRDEPIPKEFLPSSYHKDEIERDTAELDKISRMGGRRATAEAAAEYELRINAIDSYMRKTTELRSKYYDMLKEVEEWIPPTPEHAKYKQFMKDQITQSIKFDCSYTPEYPKRIGGAEWKKNRIKQLENSIKYSTEENAKEIELTTARNLWIKQLLDSLPKESK
jgi:hypothetical protein